MTNKLVPKKTGLTTGTDNLTHYLQRIKKIPVLTKEQEQKLTYELYHNDSVSAARELVTHHLRFVVYVAKNYRGYGLPLSDLIQEGNIGLMKAVKSFDPSKNVRLASFAVHWIKSEINEFVIKNWKILKIATTKEQRKLFFNLRSKKKGFNWLTKDEATQIAKDLNVPEKQVFEMESRLAGQDISFDGPDSDDDEQAINPSQWLTSDVSEDPAVIVERNQIKKKNELALQKALSTLDCRSREIVVKRWLDESKKTTLHDLAKEYNISAERIRQIEGAAMKKLKKYLIL